MVGCCHVWSGSQEWSGIVFGMKYDQYGTDVIFGQELSGVVSGTDDKP